jgi:hypothetical protein
VQEPLLQVQLLQDRRAAHGDQPHERTSRAAPCGRPGNGHCWLTDRLPGLSDAFRRRTGGARLLPTELSGTHGREGGGGAIWVPPGVRRRDRNGRAGRALGGGGTILRRQGREDDDESVDFP